MGRAPCCDKDNVKKGPWSPEEDAELKAYIEQHGTGGNWIALPHKIGLKRWSIMAAQLPGRTDNDIKNYWNTRLKKRLLGKGTLRRSDREPSESLSVSAIERMQLLQLQGSQSSHLTFYNNPVLWPKHHVPVSHAAATTLDVLSGVQSPALDFHSPSGASSGELQDLVGCQLPDLSCYSDIYSFQEANNLTTENHSMIIQEYEIGLI
ncbi:hypothetical protein ZIOFF_006542 [Zingiber officinale]|uniref:Uncharacterized protein n=1 Tax=Zingiber officinale TaxID=94328 RepID=A0A8J5LVR7_ZINOF|nr:hypothetical protein ZIOFF_006542 [Zingiber officinale]